MCAHAWEPMSDFQRYWPPRDENASTVAYKFVHGGKGSELWARRGSWKTVS